MRKKNAQAKAPANPPSATVSTPNSAPRPAFAASFPTTAPSSAPYRMMLVAYRSAPASCCLPLLAVTRAALSRRWHLCRLSTAVFTQLSSRRCLRTVAFAPLSSRRCLRAVVSSCAISTLADKGRFRRKGVLFWAQNTGALRRIAISGLFLSRKGVHNAVLGANRRYERAHHHFGAAFRCSRPEITKKRPKTSFFAIRSVFCGC